MQSKNNCPHKPFAISSVSYLHQILFFNENHKSQLLMCVLVKVMVMENKLLEKLCEIPTASLSDALDNMGIRGFMDYQIKPRTCDLKIVSFAVTVKDKISKKELLR
jgi:hypothetical protein